MTTRLTIVALAIFGVATATLNLLGRTTVSEYVWAAVDHSPIIIGFGLLTATIVAFRIRREGSRIGPLVILILGVVCGHFFWRY